jgi:hypothetical protein
VGGVDVTVDRTVSRRHDAVADVVAGHELDKLGTRVP